MEITNHQNNGTGIIHTRRLWHGNSILVGVYARTLITLELEGPSLSNQP